LQANGHSFFAAQAQAKACGYQKPQLLPFEPGSAKGRITLWIIRPWRFVPAGHVRL
jgi:hypothetical protein